MTNSQPERKRRPSARQNKDSWGGVADWYADVVEADESYQKQIILPALLRRMEKLQGKRLLDVGCGSGFFSLALAREGAKVTGIDIGADLLTHAREQANAAKLSVEFIEQSAADLKNLGTFDHVLCVLALQNMAQADRAIAAMINALEPRGTLHLVLNHPAFRIPKHTRWVQIAGTEQGQAKRVERAADVYMTEQTEAMLMHPGRQDSEQTTSYHRPLQWFFKHITNNSGVVTRLEEWISGKESQTGPWKQAEDRARKEFPLFMYIEVQKK